MLSFSFQKPRVALTVWVLALLALCVSVCAAEQAPRNVILLMGDGMGIGHVTAARIAGPGPDGKLAMDTMPYTGFVLTHPSGKLVTDSAASATALATGHKTTNGAVSVDPDGRRLKTILHLARDMGKSTGIISTKSVTDATPAAFTSQVRSRGEHAEIASQMIASGVDVVLGGGRSAFLPKTAGSGAREDGRDLLAEARDGGYDVFDSAEKMSASQSDRMIGLFAPDSMTTQPPEPTLAEMTAKAISALSRNERGFFLMSEGAQIDSFAHGNNSEGAVRQTLLFDDAVRVALDFAAEDGRTLVLVTADHDTGGMGVLDPDAENPRYRAGWVGGGHTGNMVPLYAYGPGAERFTGTHDNTRIPVICAELWGERLH